MKIFYFMELHQKILTVQSLIFVLGSVIKTDI